MQQLINILKKLFLAPATYQCIEALEKQDGASSRIELPGVRQARTNALIMGGRLGGF